MDKALVYMSSCHGACVHVIMPWSLMLRYFDQPHAAIARVAETTLLQQLLPTRVAEADVSLVALSALLLSKAPKQQLYLHRHQYASSMYIYACIHVCTYICMYFSCMRAYSCTRTCVFGGALRTSDISCASAYSLAHARATHVFETLGANNTAVECRTRACTHAMCTPACSNSHSYRKPSAPKQKPSACKHVHAHADTFTRPRSSKSTKCPKVT